MKVITTRDRIHEASKNWDATYCRPNCYYLNDEEKQRIAHELRALDAETATPDDLETIIGNRSWTRLTCDECDEDVDAVIEMGQEPDYESRTANICTTCLRKASQLLIG